MNGTLAQILDELVDGRARQYNALFCAFRWEVDTFSKNLPEHLDRAFRFALRRSVLGRVADSDDDPTGLVNHALARMQAVAGFDDLVRRLGAMLMHESALVRDIARDLECDVEEVRKTLVAYCNDTRGEDGYLASFSVWLCTDRGGSARRGA